ncbi:MAG TPA: hypothetical protein VHW02_14250 [Rhizomicrobium sp.]|jgi:hypothetical protein|nr:hypothetical protein [Rhizomicrobium sp.]
MGAKAAAIGIAFLLTAALLFIGVACGAFAIHIGLSALGEAWSWAVTAIILLLGPCMFALGIMLRRPPPRRTHDALMGILGGFAAESSFVPVILAGVLGIVELFLKRRAK